MSQSTSIFQHQWAGLWCDHRMPSVLCQSRRVYFHHLKGGSFMFFPSFFKQGSIFLIFTCKKRQKRIDRNQTNFPPARELALLILNVSCQISNSHRVVQPEQDSIIEVVAHLGDVPKAAVKASNGVRILGSNSNGTTTSYSYMMLHDVISSSIYASCAMEFILPTYLDDVMILMMYCHSSAAVLQNHLVQRSCFENCGLAGFLAISEDRKRPRSCCTAGLCGPLPAKELKFSTTFGCRCCMTVYFLINILCNLHNFTIRMAPLKCQFHCHCKPDLDGPVLVSKMPDS